MTETWNGRWWLPEEPKNQQPGILTRDDQNDLRLELVGGFDLSFSAPMPNHPGQSTFYKRSEVPLIVGITERGPVSLLGCLSLDDGRYSRRLADAFTAEAGIERPEFHRFAVHSGLVGTLLDSADQEVFTELRLEIENLASFLGKLKTVEHWNDNRTEVRLSKLATGEGAEFDGLIFRISLERTYFHDRRTPVRFDILSSVKPVIAITSPKPTSYARLEPYTKAIMDLLTLATGKPCGTIRETLDENIPDADAVTIIEKQVHKPDLSKEYKGTWGFRFTCDDMPFNDVIVRWLQLQTKVDTAINLLHAPLYNPNSYIQERLLDIAAAAETFHVWVYDFEARPADEFDQLIETMLSGVTSDDDKQWIKSRFSNTPSYNRRLRNLLIHPSQEAMNIVVPQPSKWARKLTDVRNIVAHGKREPLPDVLDCHILMQQTALVIVLNVMHQLGMSADCQLRAAEDPDLAHLRLQKEVIDLLK